MTHSFKDKVILVTGGAGGIGSAFCHHAAARGARMVIVDIDQERADELAGTLMGRDHRGIATDLTDRGQVDDLLLQQSRDPGRIDVLVNVRCRRRPGRSQVGWASRKSPS